MRAYTRGKMVAITGALASWRNSCVPATTKQAFIDGQHALCARTRTPRHTWLGCDALAREGALRPIPGRQPARHDARLTECSRYVAKNSSHHMFLSNKLASNAQALHYNRTPPPAPAPAPPSRDGHAPAVHGLEAGGNAQQHALVPAKAPSIQQLEKPCCDSKLKPRAVIQN